VKYPKAEAFSGAVVEPKHDRISNVHNYGRNFMHTTMHLREHHL
jgi:hypothetical protein